MAHSENIQALLAELPDESLAADLVRVFRDYPDSEIETRLFQILEDQKALRLQELEENDEDKTA